MMLIEQRNLFPLVEEESSFCFVLGKGCVREDCADPAFLFLVAEPGPFVFGVTGVDWGLTAPALKFKD